VTLGILRNLQAFSLGQPPRTGWLRVFLFPNRIRRPPQRHAPLREPLGKGVYMKVIGILLMLIGVGMAWSGASMQLKKERFNEMMQRGTPLPITEEPEERGYHRFFLKYFWIPLGIGGIILYLS
jgi:hypothetical protein